MNLSEEGDLENHLVLFKDLFDRLMNAGQQLEESLWIAMILRSLLHSYGGSMAALESHADADNTMQLVKSKLID